MTPRCIATNSSNRRHIGLKIALRIRLGARRLPKHIEACSEAAIVFRLHALHRFIDVAAHDKYLPHETHRCTNGLTHERFACFGDQALERARAVP